MDIFKTFVTNSENLEETFEMIRAQGIPDKFNKQFLKQLGFEKPNIVLYVNLFKKLGLVEDNERPNRSYFNKFIESDNKARKLIAQLVYKQYAKIFEEDAYAYDRSGKKLYMLFRKQMGKTKSKTIIRLVADTFKALTDYADMNVLKEDSEDNMTIDYANHNSNGSNKKADTPHEEFIVELMNDDPHQYPKNGSDSNTADVLTEQPVDEKDEGSSSDTNTPQLDELQDIMSDKMGVENGSENGSNDDQGIFLTKALMRRAELLEKLDRQEEAIAAYSDIISYSEEKKGLLGKQKITSAYYKKASMLEQIEKYEEALIAYDNLIQRFG